MMREIAPTPMTETELRLGHELSDACQIIFELRDVLTHDCGETEEIHLTEHIAPVVIRAGKFLQDHDGEPAVSGTD